MADGFSIFVDADGKLKCRGPSGTVTHLEPAPKGWRRLWHYIKQLFGKVL